MKYDKSLILYYMKIRGYQNDITLDDFDINPIFGRCNIIPKGIKFLPWALTDEYYKDVILYYLPDIREDKFKELLQ